MITKKNTAKVIAINLTGNLSTYALARLLLSARFVPHLNVFFSIVAVHSVVTPIILNFIANKMMEEDNIA